MNHLPRAGQGSLRAMPCGTSQPRHHATSISQENLQRCSPRPAISLTKFERIRLFRLFSCCFQSVINCIHCGTAAKWHSAQQFLWGSNAQGSERLSTSVTNVNSSNSPHPRYMILLQYYNHMVVRLVLWNAKRPQ